MATGDPTGKFTALGAGETIITESSNPSVTIIDENVRLEVLGKGIWTITCKVADGSERFTICEVTIVAPVKDIG